MNNHFVLLPEILLEKYGYKNSLVISLVLRNKLLDGSCILQFDDIYEQLGYYRQHRNYSQVRQLFINMQKDKLLHCKDNLEEVKNHKLLRVTLFSEGKFIKIPYADIEKILQYSEKINLFAVYVVIKKHLWEEDSTWDVSYEEIKKYTGIKHNKTIEKYLQILENLQLITKISSNYKNNNPQPCYAFSLFKKKDKEEISMKPQNQLQPHSLQDTTQTNNTFPAVSKEETFRCEQQLQKKTSGVLESKQTISPPTPTTSSPPPTSKEKKNSLFDGFSLVPERFLNSIPSTPPSPMYLQSEKSEDISDETEESERDVLEEQIVQKLQEIIHSVCVYENEDDEDLPF